jgi:hypothetical protein
MSAGPFCFVQNKIANIVAKLETLLYDKKASEANRNHYY